MLINIMDKSNINNNVDLGDRRRPIIGLPPLTIDVNCNKPLVSQLSPMSPDFHEIPSGDIQFLKTIGKGSFGVVYKARWHGSGGGRTIAVKKVETDTELSAFHNEIRQLSRVTHDNIVHMYGITSSKASKCLIMEFADGGSLYQFLHCPPYSSYNLAHALSWLLQCAKAIAYLHAIQPVPIIHRDLKPLNMLLTNRKRVLKICDFGTACDLRSVMTDNRGSTAWMAPEVIRGGKYNEKCDVHSWGMILWEVLTRRIPYEELGQPYRILWQIVNHVRPPPIQGCPAPIDKLMQSCWLDEHSARPTMQEVVDTIYPLCKLLNIKEESFSFSSSPTDSYTESCVSLINEGSSADHTSRDVSEFTNSTNNIDLMVDESSALSPETPATIGISFEQDEINSSAGNAHLHPPQVTFSSNVSASVVVGVENLLPPWGSAKSDEINSRSNVSASSTLENSSDCLVHNTNGNLSPFVLVGADHKDSSPFVFPEHTSCTVSSTTNTETFSPIDVFPAEGDVSLSTFTKNERKISPSVFTPLSISIPNLGPPERTDVGLTSVAHSSNVLYSSSSNSPLINYIHSGYVTPVCPSVSCSATSTHTSRIHCPTTAVSSLRMGSNYFLPAVTYSFPEQPIVSPNIFTSPSITSIATSLTLISPMKAKPYDSPVILNEISQGMVTLRKNLTPSNPAAIYRRRSAEVPLNSTNYKGISSVGQGHRRSSSYESKELIGFEPLLNEVLQESSLEDRYIVSQPKIIKHNFSSEKLTQDDGRLKGTFSSPDNPSQSSGTIISGQPCITVAPHESSALSNISFASSGGTVTPSYSHHLTSGVVHTPITTATTRVSTISSPLSIRGSGSPSGRTPNVIPFKKGTIGGGTTDRVSENEELGALWELLDDDLKPAMPVQSNHNSQQIFDEHKSLAHQLLIVQEEIVFLDQEKSKLRMKVKGQDSEQIACKKRYNDKIFDLQNKNETLQLNHSRLSQQLEEIRSRNRQRCSESWNPSEAVPPQSVHSAHNHSHPRPTVEGSHWSPHHQRQQYYHQLHSPMQHLNLQQHYYHDHSLNSPPNPPNPKRN